MSELGVLDDENCITGLMRNLAKHQAQKPIPGKSGNKRNKKKVKNKKKTSFKLLWRRDKTKL